MGFIKPLVTVVILYKTKYFNGENIHKVMSARIVIINSNRDYFIDFDSVDEAIAHAHKNDWKIVAVTRTSTSNR